MRSSSPKSGFAGRQDSLGRLLRRIATLILVSGGAILSVSPENRAYPAENARRPNVVLILADDK